MTLFLSRYKHRITMIVLFFLCWLFPYTGDDWAWGSQIGLDRLYIWFENYNGRYLGNLIVLVLTRSNLLKSAAMSATLTGILYLLEKLSGCKQAFSISALLLLLMPRTLSRQVVVWTSGFTNYAVSSLIVLVYVQHSYRYWGRNCNGLSEKATHKYAQTAGFFLLGAASTLIVEHITLYSLAIASCVLGVVWIRFRGVVMQQAAYLCGAVIGAVYMFSNSAYQTIASGNDGYRTIATGIASLISRAATNYLEVIQMEAYQRNIGLNVALFVVCFLLFRSIYKKLSPKIYTVLTICLAMMLLNLVYTISLSDLLALSAGMENCISGFLAVISLSSLSVFALTISRNQDNFGKIAFILASILFICTELLVVTPLGSRCFFITYILFVLLLLELAGLLPAAKPVHWIEVSRYASIVVLLGMYFVILGCNCKVDRDRLKYVRDQVARGQAVIQIQNYPFESFLWCSVPQGDVWAPRYKLFYDLPEDITLIPVDFYFE